MSWPYHFITLSDEDIHIRRQLLDGYGSYAQLSALVPILVFQLVSFGQWLLSGRKRTEVEYAAVPSSPTLKTHRLSKTGGFVAKWRQIRWWLDTDVGKGWGSREQWIAGIVWTIWLMFLAVHRTGEDYMHVTKRFGIIAGSQLPVHYMLSMKSPYSPMALALKASHEELNRWHRVSGRVIYFFLCLHATFYLNFFVQNSLLLKKLTQTDVILGLMAFMALTILMSTALQLVRRFSYRIFFICHLAIGVTVLPILFFHVTHIRIYVLESLALFLLDTVFRKLDTITAFAKITQITNTNLIQVTVPIPATKMSRFSEAPGQHVYLSLPSASAQSSISQLLFNPFSIGSVSPESKTMSLVLRVLKGPTTLALEHLTKLSKANPPIKIEGPYGSARHFPKLVEDYDRVLLFAGGIGSTFVVPIWKEIEEARAREGREGQHKLRVIWTVKDREEATWAATKGDVSELNQDPNLELYVTSTPRPSTSVPYDGVAVEMGELRGKKGQEEEGFINGRPDVGKIVDEIFRLGAEERVAVLVCGPEGLAREVRTCVGKWVGRGREVWFHDEAFGW